MKILFFFCCFHYYKQQRKASRRLTGFQCLRFSSFERSGGPSPFWGAFILFVEGWHGHRQWTFRSAQVWHVWPGTLTLVRPHTDELIQRNLSSWRSCDFPTQLATELAPEAGTPDPCSLPPPPQQARKDPVIGSVTSQGPA